LIELVVGMLVERDGKEEIDLLDQFQFPYLELFKGKMKKEGEVKFTFKVIT